MTATLQTMTLDVDEQGIALVTFNDPDQSMNVVSPHWLEELTEVVERVAAAAEIVGAILTSGKPSFMAGADLKHILTLAGGAISQPAARAFSQRASRLHRRIETCGKPFVAALNGLALGGGFELALACHHRVMSENPAAVVGLPEVTVGLLPGSGGTQRLPRMIGIEPALDLLLSGRKVDSAHALRLGLIDERVAQEQLLEAARRWILGAPQCTRPWDEKGYRGSSGLLDPAVARLMSEQAAAVAARGQHNYPAPITILECVFEGMQMPFDKALALESKHFARLLCDPVARNLIRTSFITKSESMKLPRRPSGIPRAQVRTVGVLGAGMMGAGIAYVCACAGLDVVLLDRTVALAIKGRSRSERLLNKEVESGRRSAESARATLERIRASDAHIDLASCDLVVEAVFEDPAVKAQVIGRAESVLKPSALIASNTSTLPISSLAAACSRRAQFIGLHFFSPVERMPIVEVIVGADTAADTLARSLDFVAQLKMSPVVVRDSRGFYTSRVFQTFIHEAMSMVGEGVKPALIENAARLAGFPLGPLALLDEVTLDLPWKIVQETQAALGARFVRPAGYEVLRRMLEELGRHGRRHGRGFYEYPQGGAKRLWSGLNEAFPITADQPSVTQVRKRLLYIQSVESARCLEEGVLEHPADGDLASVLAWGFPAWTGGTFTLIDTVGTAAFVEECERLAARHGERFLPGASLRELARRGESFYASMPAAPMVRAG